MNRKAEQTLERVLERFDERSAKRDDGLLRRISGIEIKSLDEKARTVDVVASSEAIDSYDEIVLQDWDLSRYEKNPTVLYLHNAGGGFCGPTTKDTFPVGFATNVRLEGGKLLATLNFVDEKASPLAEYCWQGFVQKSLRAVSVGFRPRDVKPGKVDGKEVYFLSGNELFEISVVPMGANPDAVALTHQRNVALLKARVAKALEPVKSGVETPKMELEKKITELETELSASKKAATDAVAEATATKAALTELQARLDKSEAGLKEANEKLSKAEDKAIELEVDALVGKKIAPAEKATMLKLRKRDPELFAEQMALRPDSKLTERVVADDPKPENTTKGDGASERLAKAAEG